MTGRVGLGRWMLFWAIALGGAAFDVYRSGRLVNECTHGIEQK